MANIPEFSDIADYRYNGFAATYSARGIGYAGNPVEERIVPSTSPYILILHESPRRDVPSTVSIYDSDDMITLTEVEKTQTPANNQFRVNYDELGNGQVEFNVSQSGHNIEISYYGLGSINKKEMLQAVLKEVSAATIQLINSDTTMDDDQGLVGIIQLQFDCRTGNKTVTLPKANLNEGLVIGWKQLYWGGRLELTGKTGDTIDGFSSIYGDDKLDCGEIYSDGSEWKIRSIRHRLTFLDEDRNTSVWTSVQLGSVYVGTKNESGGSPTVGEVIRESGTGVQGILVYWDSTGHILHLKNVNGTFTNNLVLTGQTSGWTCNADEPTGSTKNKSDVVWHFMGKTLKEIKVNDFVISTSNSEITRFSVLFGNIGSGADSYGIMLHANTTNSFAVYTATDGILYIASGGAINTIDNEDWFYNFYIEFLYI